MASPCPCGDPRVDAPAHVHEPVDAAAMSAPQPPGYDAEQRALLIVLDCLRRGEPFFPLRAKDVLALDTLEHYQRRYHELAGYGNLDFAERLQRNRTDFENWRAGHNHLLKFPD